MATAPPRVACEVFTAFGLAAAGTAPALTGPVFTADFFALPLTAFFISTPVDAPGMLRRIT